MRPRVEAKHQRRAVVTGLAQPGMAIAAGQHMLLEDFHLHTAGREQSRRRQAADSRADDGDIEFASSARRGEIGRRPVKFLGRRKLARQHRAHQPVRPENRENGPGQRQGAAR